MKPSSSSIIVKEARISPYNPEVFAACKGAALLIAFYSTTKQKYFERYIKGRTKATFRNFEAITSDRFIYEGAKATRGLQKGRNGIIETIRYTLFTAIRDTLRVAQNELKIEFDSNKKQTESSPSTQPMTDKEEKESQRREARKQKNKKQAN